MPLAANLQPTTDIPATVKNALVGSIQSGTATFAAATKVVTFPIAFTSTPIVVVTGVGTTTATLTVSSQSATGFTCTGTNTEVFNWIAF